MQQSTQTECTDEHIENLQSRNKTIEDLRYKIWLTENALVLVAIFILQMVLLKRKKKNSFEVKIILCMFFAYLEGFAFRLDMVFYDN